ncbi:AMP-binding protein [Rhodococcoides yunnanense]|uniref:AMP-binding protein n=1 Tax=Rhodococcoides yunnanense TaxID=278209 RepID=UPI0009352186|nr:AMP-binding protein [Rhodococcus yunnanensis]
MSVHDVATRSHPALAPLCKPDLRDTVLGRLCEVAHAVPTATALTADDQSVTYDQLLHRIYALARRITAVAPGTGRPIAVDGSSTVDAVTLMLAVIASGRALVPLDPALPETRRASIVEHAQAWRLDAGAIETAEYSSVPLPAVTGEHIAVIAFTSGSTGRPKGVMLSNRMCLTKAYEVSSTLGLSTRHRVGNALPVSFGAGLDTVLAGILSGAEVHCRDPRSARGESLTQWITRYELTTLHGSPLLVRAMCGAAPPGVVHAVPDNRIPSLQYVVTYGEALYGRDVTSFRSGTGCGATFVNWYATTETGAVARHKYGAEDAVPTGLLAAGTCPAGKLVDIIRADGTLARPGDIGQIRVTADCFADGYLDLPGRTDERFTTDSGRHRFLTGDLGRIDDHGLLQLVGRVDDRIREYAGSTEQSEESRTPVFVAADGGFSGGGFSEAGLAALANLLTDHPVYVLQTSGTARMCVRELRRRRPHGPYVVAGHAHGASIALEMAHILRAEGDVVERVILLDPPVHRRLLDRVPGLARVRSLVTLQSFTTLHPLLARHPLLTRHRPTAWDGPVTVLVTDGNTPNTDSWAAITTGELDVTQVAARRDRVL